jgi:transcriptional regulator with XRE-family HTH domain
MSDMIEQEELRRRLHAARVLRGLTFGELASRIGRENRLSERTLRKIEGGEEQLRELHLRTIAPALELPYEFFTVEDVGRALVPDPVADRLTRLERTLEELRTETRGPDTAAPRRAPRSRPKTQGAH